MRIPMRTHKILGLLTMFLLVSCSSTPRTILVTPSSRVYHGTASVGDFMTITIDSTAGTIAYTECNQSGSPFNTGTIDLTQAQADPSRTFLTIAEQGGSGSDYIFGTANGVFAVDSPNGAILGLKKAASKDFDPSLAGTYKAIY